MSGRGWYAEKLNKMKKFDRVARAESRAISAIDEGKSGSQADSVKKCIRSIHAQRAQERAEILDKIGTLLGATDIESIKRLNALIAQI